MLKLLQAVTSRPSYCNPVIEYMPLLGRRRTRLKARAANGQFASYKNYLNCLRGAMWRAAGLPGCSGLSWPQLTRRGVRKSRKFLSSSWKECFKIRVQAGGLFSSLFLAKTRKKFDDLIKVGVKSIYVVCRSLSLKQQLLPLIFSSWLLCLKSEF